MKYELRIQDPTDPPQSAMLDVIVETVRLGVVRSGRWFFGFLTGSGMDALLAVPEVAEMLDTAALDVLVGLDAVTDRRGLARLQDVSARNPGFTVRVIKNTTGALIHPKLLAFEYEDGGGAVVVGSNNMSANGLGGNVEGYSVLRYEAAETPDLSDWDAFVQRWGPLLSPIDDDAMRRAERNERRADLVRRVVRPRRGDDIGVVVTDGQVHEFPLEPGEGLYEPMLVAQIPRAGGRWSQVHYSKDILQGYFQADAGDSVFLRQHGDSRIEEPKVVYSARNKNYKIELGAARVIARIAGYPITGRPVVLLRREGGSLRHHRYVLLMPGDPGHAELAALSMAEFRGRTNHLPRVVVPRSRVLAAWPDCPL